MISDMDVRINPFILQCKIQADKKSLYNTLLHFNLYMAGKGIKWIQSLHGLEKLKEINKRKPSILYDYMDSSSSF